MGLIDRLFRTAGSEPAFTTATKEPGFAVTQFTPNNPFTNLIAQEDNYFDQYILYSSKAIDYISNKLASSDIFLADNEEKILVDNELWDDLQAFNPYMTLWEARKLKEVHKFITGAAYWFIDRKPGPGYKVAFYPLDPTKMQIKTDSNGLPSYYQYTDARGKTVQLDPADVIYFRRTDPKNWFQGQSIFKELNFWTNAYAAGAQYNMNKLGNSSNVDKFLIFEGISDKNRIELEERLLNKYNGPRNAGRTGVLSSKLDVVDLAPNQKDLDYVAGMKMLRQDILAGFGIPEALFFPSATNSNSKEAARLFQSDTLEPLMQQEKSALNEQVIPKYGSSRAKEGDVHFGFYPVVDQDKTELVSQAKELAEIGVLTRNQVLEYVGMEPIEGAAGDEYINNAVQNERIEAADQEIKELKTKSAKFSEALNTLIEKQEDAEFFEKNIRLIESQEGLMHQSAEVLFREQFSETVKYLNSTDKPSVRKIFDIEIQKQNTISTFKETYGGVIGNSNDVANVEIKQKLFAKKSNKALEHRHKSLSGTAADTLAEHINYFAGELTEVTAKKLRTILAEGIKKGFDKSELIADIQDVFNGYVDGSKNMELLKSLGVYIPDMQFDAGEFIFATGNRYKQILDNINELRTNGTIDATQSSNALKALRGLISPTDPTGVEVDNLLTNVYKVNKNEGISYARAVTIARTESTYARNLGFEDTYKDNPFIVGKKWRSLHDKDTRSAHANADGQVVPIGDSFTVGGEQLDFPCDGSKGASAENIVNCRCRITAEVTD